MPEDTQQVVPDSLGWRAGLPDDLKQNEAFTGFKTVGEFGKHYLEVSSKAKELEGKLADYVPKLPDDATDEERSLYLEALGRPEQPSEYEFEGEDKNAPEWTSYWKQAAHELGLTKTQAKQLSGKFNAQMQQLVDAHNASLKTEMEAAEQKLKSELGDKYETTVELAKRMTQTHLGKNFDEVFDGLGAEARFGVVRLLMKVANLTGEDRSPRAGQTPTPSDTSTPYPKSNMPPARVFTRTI
jgi:hypothetical protein